MASTNKTTNYELSQFLGTDKPAWLSDYNTDMSKIDAQMKVNADAATAAGGTATAASTAIGTLANLTTDVKTSVVAAINEVDSHADTAQNTATQAATTANEAKTLAQLIQSELNLTSSQVTCTISNGTLDTSNDNNKLTVAKNTSGSLAKIYGRLRTTGGYGTITSGDTGLRPTEAITFRGCALRYLHGTGWTSHLVYQNFTLGTNGVITTEIPNVGTTDSHDVLFMANLLFVKNFGDTPQPD